MIGELLQSHRVSGREIGRAKDHDGREFVILQTAPHRQEIVMACMVRPMTDADKFAADLLQDETNWRPPTRPRVTGGSGWTSWFIVGCVAALTVGAIVACVT